MKKVSIKLSRDITPSALDGWDFEFDVDGEKVSRFIKCGCSGRLASCLMSEWGTGVETQRLAAIAIVAGHIAFEIKTQKQLLDINKRLSTPLNISPHFTLEEAKSLAKGKAVPIHDVWS